VQQHIAGEIREFPDESTGEKNENRSKSAIVVNKRQQGLFYWRTRYIWAEGIPKTVGSKSQPCIDESLSLTRPLDVCFPSRCFRLGPR